MPFLENGHFKNVQNRFARFQKSKIYTTFFIKLLDQGDLLEPEDLLEPGDSLDRARYLV